MGLFLDSAIIDEAKRVAELGFVRGITTNPTLMAAAKQPPLKVLKDLAGIQDWLVFHQLTGETDKALLEEAKRATDIAPGRILLKIMMSLSNLDLVVKETEFRWAVTAIGNSAQGVLAAEAGAEYIIPYVNRITRSGGDGPQVVAELSTLIELMGESSQILAASLKSCDEVVQTLLAGANDVTIPWKVFEEMAHHPVTDQSAEGFRQVLSGK